MLGKSKEIQALTEMADQIKGRAKVYTIVYFGLCVILTFLSTLPKDRVWLCGALLISSAISLVVGLSAPIISVTVYQDLPAVGRAVIQFESLGIISSIDKLWISGNHIIAAVIFIFSLIVPITKTAAMGTIMAFPHASASSRLLKLFKAIGKWSMTDVFLVALIISVFSFSNMKSTDAFPQMGLYYFIAFVVLSMNATHIFHKVLASNEKTQTTP